MAINRIRADIDLDAILYNMESMHNKLQPGTMMCDRRYVHMRQLRSYRVSLSLRIKPVRYISR